MFLIRPLHRSNVFIRAGLSALIVAALFFPKFPASAFQSFEDFSRSKNIGSLLEVTTLTDPGRVQPGQDFDLHLDVRLREGWHIYSLQFQGNDETLATRIHFNENVFSAQGDWMEPQPAITLDGALNKVVKIHEDAVRFSRTLKVPNQFPSGTYPVSGSIEFRACDNKICSLPKEVGFQTRLQVLGELAPMTGEQRRE